MEKTKVRLSEQEMEMVVNAELILTKNRILKKVGELLAGLQEPYREILENDPVLPRRVLETQAKISRGENYEGLPYQVLDYPRLFSREEIFAIRTMFWWGHHFSITLHLRGAIIKEMEPFLLQHFTQIKDQGFYISTGSDEWEHHFRNDNYLPLTDMDEDQFREKLNQPTFIKLAKKYHLDQWPVVSGMLLKDFERLTSVGKR